MTIIYLYIKERGCKHLTLLWYFLAGFFAINGIPHLVKGITGQTHMTPFKRVSSPVLNVAWGLFNFLVALFILGLATGQGGMVLPWNANLADMYFWAFFVGAAANGLYLANFWSNPKARLPWQK